MSMHAATPFRPGRAVLTGLGWRAALVVAAAIAVALTAPAWLRAPLSVGAALATATFFTQRYRRRGALDRWLIAIGGGVVLTALLGLLLNLLPSGLSAPGWAIGAAVLQLVLLGGLALLRPPMPRARRRPSRRAVVAAAGWSAAVAGVLAAAVILSAVSFGSTHVAPLAVQATPRAGAITVSVTSGATAGPYRLELVTDTGRTVLAQGVRVGPDSPATAVLRLPAGTRGLVQLIPAGSTAAVRELIVDSTLQAGTP